MASKKEIEVSIRNIQGGYTPLDLFKFFDDGIRKRLPRLFAQELYDTLIENIETNKFNFHLATSWINYKRSIGADERPFIMFDYYKKAISIFTQDGHLTVGFKRSVQHPRAQKPMGELAVYLEYGDLARSVPARPLWRWTVKQLFEDKKERMAALARQALR